MLKPLFTAFAVMVMAASGHAADPQPATASAPDRVFTIGFPQDNMADEWRAAQVQAVADTLAGQSNVRCIYSDAAGSTAKNLLDLEDMIDQGVDLLMVSPRDPVAMSPILSRAYRLGIPIVLLTRRMINDDYTLFISPNDATIAGQAAEQITKVLNGTGKVLMLQGVPTASTVLHRTEGFLEAIKSHPGIEVVAIKPANYLRADAIKVVQEMLEQKIPFDAIYAQDDAMASGARIALIEAGIDPATVPIVGIDYISEAREAIRAGDQVASFTYPTCGEQAAELALRILRGEAVPREVEVPSVMVTRENVERVETIF